MPTTTPRRVLTQNERTALFALLDSGLLTHRAIADVLRITTRTVERAARDLREARHG